jgi:hypothetical protein
VDWIENQHGKAYVEDRNAYRADVLVDTPRVGSKHLRKQKDGVWTDTLLAPPRT